MSEQNQKTKRLYAQIEKLIQRIGDLTLLSPEKRVERVTLVKEHYPEIVQELKSIREPISDMLLLPLSQPERAFFESFYQVLGWLFPEEHQPVKKSENNIDSRVNNLSLYPNMQAHIQHKLK